VRCAPRRATRRTSPWTRARTGGITRAIAQGTASSLVVGMNSTVVRAACQMQARSACIKMRFGASKRGEGSSHEQNIRLVRKQARDLVDPGLHASGESSA